MSKFPFERLIRALIRLHKTSQRMGDASSAVTQIENDIEERFGIVLQDYEEYNDGVFAHASNGEWFEIPEQDLRDLVKELLKEKSDNNES